MSKDKTCILVKEQRILYAMDILTKAECRDFTCKTFS